MDDILTRFPHLAKACLEMSYDNGGIHRYRNEDVAKEEYRQVLGADGVYEEDLKIIDDFIATLTEDEVMTLVAGEETEMQAIVARCSIPEKLDGLLNDIFEVC
jgi:hypothetical protein